LALILEPQQRPFESVGRPSQAIVASKQLRAADCADLFRAQPRHIETWPIAIAVSHRDIDIVAGEIDVVHRRLNPQVDAWMGRRETRQPMHQPFAAKSWRRA